MSNISVEPRRFSLNASSNDTVPVKHTSENAPPSEAATPSWQKLSTYTKFNALLARDTERGVLTSGGKELLSSLTSPDKTIPPKTDVLSFAIGGVPANDMFIVRRNPVTPGSTNIVLHMPENDFKSFYEFQSTQEMRAFLKDIPKSPAAFSAFFAHFGSDEKSGAIRSVVKSMEEWAAAPENTKPKVAMGGSSYIFGNVFERQERLNNEPVNPISVNGLTDLQREWVSPRGFAVYSGQRPDGERVLYKYDTAGNLTGLGDKGNYYFVKDALWRRAPLVPLTAEQYSAALQKEVLKSLEDGGVEGLVDILRPLVSPKAAQGVTSPEKPRWNYNEGALGLLKQGLAEFLENPFFWTSEFLEQLGVDKGKAAFVERTLDNPVASLLKYANKYNNLGNRLGMEKPELDKAFDTIGGILQGLVPYYGQARGLGSLGSKAIKNEPVSDQALSNVESEFQNRFE